MKLHVRPSEHTQNKFVLSEDEAYFLPYVNEAEAPSFIQILRQIFDLDDPEVFREVDGKLFGGKIILGYYSPSTKEVIISTPLESSEYVEKRIKEVFGQ